MRETGPCSCRGQAAANAIVAADRVVLNLVVLRFKAPHYEASNNIGSGIRETRCLLSDSARAPSCDLLVAVSGARFGGRESCQMASTDTTPWLRAEELRQAVRPLAMLARRALES